MTKQYLKYARIRNVKQPARGTAKSAGLDFYVPEFDEKFQADMLKKNPNMTLSMFVDGKFELHPQQRVLIPSGIHVNLEDLGKDMQLKLGSGVGIAFIAHNKSGVGSLKGLDRLAEVVDEDYQGEVHISIVNTGSTVQIISQGEKLIQLLLMPVLYSDVLEYDNAILYEKESERGAGAFGSTDKTNNTNEN